MITITLLALEISVLLAGLMILQHRLDVDRMKREHNLDLQKIKAAHYPQEIT